MFSRQNQELDQIFTYYTTSRDSLKWYLDGIMNNEVVDSLYIGYTKQELRDAFLGYIDELEKNIIFSFIAGSDPDKLLFLCIMLSKIWVNKALACTF